MKYKNLLSWNLLLLTGCSTPSPHPQKTTPIVPPSLQMTTRVPVKVQLALHQDLLALRNVRISNGTPLQRQIFGFAGDCYFNFFMRRVKIVDSEPSKQDFFVNAGGSRDPGKLYVTAEYERYLKTMPQIERWAILVHEARHNENTRTWPHTLCPTPFTDYNGRSLVTPWGENLSGKFACDSEALGSYGVTIIMARNIELFCDNCTQDLKNQAGLYGKSLLPRIINSQSRKLLLDDLYGGHL